MPRSVIEIDGWAMGQKITDAECRKLLGGYAAGTLTPEEREALFSAALSDPDLFAALAEEQTLKDVLDDASARADLLAAVEDRPFSIRDALRDWFERPKARILTAVAAVLLVAIGVRELRERSTGRQTEGTQVVALTLPQSAAPIAEQPVPPAPRAVTPPAPAPARAARREHLESLSQATKQDTKGAAQSEPVLDFTVAAVRQDGSEVEVSADHQFGPDERARVRVQSRMPGTLVARAGGTTLYAGTVSPGAPVLLSRDLKFQEQDAVAVDLDFTPLAGTAVPGGAPSASSMMRARPTFQLRSPESAGVVGGVPSPASPPQVPSESVPARKEVQEPVHLRISLHRRK